jgi:hypothetical protein
MSDNNAMIGLLLINCPMDSGGDQYRSMFVSASKPFTNYGTKIAANPLAEERAANATLSSFYAKIGAFGWCVYRKLKLGRSGDEVRPGWRVN